MKTCATNKSSILIGRVLLFVLVLSHYDDDDGSRTDEFHKRLLVAVVRLSSLSSGRK